MNVLYEWMENPFKIIEMGVLFRYPTPRLVDGIFVSDVCYILRIKFFTTSIYKISSSLCLVLKQLCTPKVLTRRSALPGDGYLSTRRRDINVE